MLNEVVHHTAQDLPQMIRRLVAVARRLNDCRVWNPEWVADPHRIEAEPLVAFSTRPRSRSAIIGRPLPQIARRAIATPWMFFT